MALRITKQLMMMKFRTSLEFPGESTVARSTRSGLGGSAPPQGPPGTYCRWDKHGSAHLMMGRWRHKTRLYEYVACVMARLMWASDELHAKLINVISKTIDPSTPPLDPAPLSLTALSPPLRPASREINNRAGPAAPRPPAARAPALGSRPSACPPCVSAARARTRDIQHVL